MTLLEEFARLLEARGLGEYKEDGSAGGTIFLLALPSNPDQCLAIAPYGSGEADALLPYDEVSLQFRCRGTATDARTALTAGQAVYDSLHGLGEPLVLPGGTPLINLVGTQGGPVYIGRDNNARHEVVVNMRAEVRRVTANRP